MLTFIRPNTVCCMFCLRILAHMKNRLSQTTILFGRAAGICASVPPWVQDTSIGVRSLENLCVEEYV